MACGLSSILGSLGEHDNAGLGLDAHLFQKMSFFSKEATMLLTSLLDSGSSLMTLHKLA